MLFASLEVSGGVNLLFASISDAANSSRRSQQYRQYLEVSGYIDIYIPPSFLTHINMQFPRYCGQLP